MKKIFIIIAAVITFVGCKEDNETAPALDVDKTAIAAAYTAGTYDIAVTGNVAWTATVNSEAATWCTLSNASGNSNGGMITINVTENPTAGVERIATVTFTADMLTRTVTVTQAAVAPVLTASPTVIAAAATAGTYTIAVASNTAWTATVNTAATWCAAAPASGSGNGTVTVSVENAALTTRVATITFTAGTLTFAVSVTQDASPYIVGEDDNPPAYAASNKVWVFGNSTLIWSDAIHIPACNKEDFTASYVEPQCRSYTENRKTWYYYNWPYVNANKTMMCPSPWRVPSANDFVALIYAIDDPTLTENTILYDAWGGGGVAWWYDDEAYGVSWANLDGYYWSATEVPENNYAYVLHYSTGGAETGSVPWKDDGLEVRCVK